MSSSTNTSITWAYDPVSGAKIPGFNPPLNPPVAGTYLTPIEITLSTISFLALCLRLYSRLCILRSPGIDDILVTIAWILAVVVTVAHVLSVELWGWGRHYLDLYQPDAVRLWIAELVHWIVYPISALLVKFSMLFFYLRLSLGHHNPKRFRLMVYYTMVFVTIWTVSLIITLLCSCYPLRKWWSYNMTEGYCWDGVKLGVIMFVQTTLNLISDVIVFLLPINMVWKANVSRKKRLQMVCVLGLGLLVCIIALLRVKLLVSAITARDISWYGYSFYVAVATEMHLCIVCAAVPFCKPVLRFWRDKLRENGKWPFDKSMNTSIQGNTSGGGGGAGAGKTSKGWSQYWTQRSGESGSSAAVSVVGKPETEMMPSLSHVYDPLERIESGMRGGRQGSDNAV